MITGTPSGAPCPTGTWTATVSSCGAATIWVVQTSSNAYAVGFTAPIEHNGQCTGTESQSNLPATWNGSARTLTVSIPEDNGCAGSNFVVVGSVDASCHSGQLTATVTGCGSCGSGTGCVDRCCGCGGTTCQRGSTIWTRQ